MNNRIERIYKEVAEQTKGNSQRIVQTLLIAKLSQEIKSMELEISQWKESATKHQTK